MCEVLVPLDELKALRWSIAALARGNRTPGSYDAENALNAARGIETRLDWVIRTLEKAGEGQRNMGVR
jgi:hypothetical protein